MPFSLNNDEYLQDTWKAGPDVSFIDIRIDICGKGVGNWELMKTQIPYVFFFKLIVKDVGAYLMRKFF